MPAFQKIYVILGTEDEGHIERLCQHVNLTSNLYLVTGNLPDSMPHVERILKGVSEFLRGSLFTRIYVHLVHPVPQGSINEIRLCYQYLKQATSEFDREGFIHQEVPRLMLLPVLIPDEQNEPAALMDLLDEFKKSFLLPSLYLDKSTFFFAEDETLLTKAEKVYYANGNSRELSEIVCNLCHQDVLDDSCAMLESGSMVGVWLHGNDRSVPFFPHCLCPRRHGLCLRERIPQKSGPDGYFWTDRGGHYRGQIR
jgi:hypothetical protein